MPRFRNRINTSAFLSATRLPTPPPLFFSTTPGAVTFHLYENAPSTAVHRTIPFPLIRKNFSAFVSITPGAVTFPFVRKCSFNRRSPHYTVSSYTKKLLRLRFDHARSCNVSFVRKYSFNRVYRTIPFPLIRKKIFSAFVSITPGAVTFRLYENAPSTAFTALYRFLLSGKNCSDCRSDK